MYIYEDPRTGEIFHYSRRGRYRKNGRTLIFKGKAHINKSHILNETQYEYGDKKAGYPPNCNEGYHEENGKCVPDKRKNN